MACVALAVMVRRTVLTTSGPTRLARITGTLRRGPDGELILYSEENETPVVVLAPHTVLSEGPDLLADSEGTPVVREGERVELVGGSSPEGPGFYAARVLVVEP